LEDRKERGAIVTDTANWLRPLLGEWATLQDQLDALAIEVDSRVAEAVAAERERLSAISGDQDKLARWLTDALDRSEVLGHISAAHVVIAEALAPHLIVQFGLCEEDARRRERERIAAWLSEDEGIHDDPTGQAARTFAYMIRKGIPK
jgi:hypothetical protein